MQGEDDLRGLAKIMAFMRAVSILLILMHFYWFCYGFFYDKGWTLQLVNRILAGFQEKAGLFSEVIYTKLFALVLLALISRSAIHATGIPIFVPSFLWNIFE